MSRQSYEANSRVFGILAENEHHVTRTIVVTDDRSFQTNDELFELLIRCDSPFNNRLVVVVHVFVAFGAKIHQSDDAGTDRGRDDRTRHEYRPQRLRLRCCVHEHDESNPNTVHLTTG